MHKVIRTIVITAVATAYFAISASTVLAAGGVPYRHETVKRLTGIEEKIVGLAEAVPAEKYSWRPMEGVRSIGEVYLHVAQANFRFSTLFGTPSPEGFNFRGYDKSTTNKAEIISKVKDSFAHFRGAIEKLSADDADKTIKAFGEETTMRAVIGSLLEHLSEHLGQSIAYARTNRVVPPWSH